MPMPSPNCVINTTQCHARKRKSKGLILQNVKKSIRKMSGGNIHVRCLKIGNPITPTTIANDNALRSKNLPSPLIAFTALYSATVVYYHTIFAGMSFSRIFT